MTDGITVSRGSTVVWRANGSVASVTQQSVQPGETVTLTANWNGRPNVRGVKRLSAGAYTATFTAGGYTATAAIRIVR